MRRTQVFYTDVQLVVLGYLLKGAFITLSPKTKRQKTLIKTWMIARSVCKEWKTYADENVSFDQLLIRHHIVRGNSEAVSFLEDKPGIKVEIELTSSIIQDRESILLSFLQKERVRRLANGKIIQQVLSYALSKNCRHEMAKRIIKDSHWDIGLYDSLIQRCASTIELLDAFQERWDIDDHLMILIEGGVVYGNLQVVKRLLDHPKLTPEMLRKAVRLSATGKVEEIALMILEHPLLDSSTISYHDLLNDSLETNQDRWKTYYQKCFSHPNFVPSDKSLRRACNSNNLWLVRLLLLEPTLDPLIVEQGKFLNLERIELILSYPRIPFSYSSLIRHFIYLRDTNTEIQDKDRYAEIILNLIDTKDIDISGVYFEGYEEHNQVLLYACNLGCSKLVQGILSHPKFDLSELPRVFDWNFSDPIVVSTLLKDGRLDPSMKENFSLKYAINRKNKPVVMLLLSDPRVDPSAGSDAALIYFASEGDGDMLERLLKDSRVDPSSQNNLALTSAASKGHMSAVKVLLNDPRVNPNGALISSLTERHDHIFNLIMGDDRVDPSFQNNASIKMAVVAGRNDYVQLLLRDPRVDASVDENYCLIEASSRGLETIVVMLLKDSRVDPSSQSNLAITIATRSGYHEIVSLLKNDSRYREEASMIFDFMDCYLD